MTIVFNCPIFTYMIIGKEELDGLLISALRCTIAEVKQRWSVIGWVTKYLLSRASPCFERHVKPLVPAAFAVVCTHQPALGPCGGPFSLCVIRKDCAPAVGTLIGWWWSLERTLCTRYERRVGFISHLINCFCAGEGHVHNQPINVLIVGAQAFLADYTLGDRVITHHAGPVRTGGC
jgi:hypothetical protein